MVLRLLGLRGAATAAVTRLPPTRAPYAAGIAATHEHAASICSPNSRARKISLACAAVRRSAAMSRSSPRKVAGRYSVVRLRDEIRTRPVGPNTSSPRNSVWCHTCRTCVIRVIHRTSSPRNPVCGVPNLRAVATTWSRQTASREVRRGEARRTTMTMAWQRRRERRRGESCARGALQRCAA